jgi:hypothetical protein
VRKCPASGLPLETDIVRTGRHVSKVPTPDMRKIGDTKALAERVSKNFTRHLRLWCRDPNSREPETHHDGTVENLALHRRPDGAAGGGDAGGGADRLSSFLASKSISPFVSKELSARISGPL